MGKPMEDTAIEESLIDDSFRDLVSPVAIHRMGREDIVENRPGDVLVEAVSRFAAKGGFKRSEKTEVEADVKVSVGVVGRIGLDAAKELVAGLDEDKPAVEVSE